MKLRLPTLLWLALAAGLSAAVHLGGAPAEGPGGFVSTRSSARRVFPTLSEVTMESATITLRSADGTAVVFEPSPDGHALRVDGAIIGPADPRAVEGLWASLRMATTVRAVSDGSAVSVASLGSITVQAGSLAATLQVGGRTPDDTGRYGQIDSPDFDPEGPASQTWVVESEMAEILEQPPRAWLARRALLVEPGQVLSVQLADASLRRGEDGRWRSQVGDTSALLSTDAVEARLGRLVGARMSPLLPEGPPRKPEPWITLEATGARTWSLERAGACPDGSARIVLVRGEGWPGCIDAASSGAWPLPGLEDVPGAGSLLEPHLSPYGYGDLLRIEQRLPSKVALAPNVGDWRLSTPEGERTIDGPEVFAWYERIAEAEVELAPAQTADPVWAVELELTTQSTQRLRLRCGPPGPGRICQRDDGPLLRLRTGSVVLAADARTFADRDLLTFAVEDVRSLEVLTGSGPRQSVHFDLGVWRLDAPQHPEGDAALSDVLLGEVLGAAGSLRVESWIPRPASDPTRTLRIEQTPTSGGDAVVLLELWPDPDDPDACLAAVGEQAGRLRSRACARLNQDLLHTDPVQFWLDTARSIEVTSEGHSTRFERTREGLVGEGPHAQDDFALLQGLATRRVVRLQASPPARPDGVLLRVLPKRGERLDAIVSGDTLTLRGQTWQYRFGD